MMAPALVHGPHAALVVNDVEVGVIRSVTVQGSVGGVTDAYRFDLVPGTERVDLARRPGGPDLVKEFAGGNLRVLLNGVPVEPHHARVRVDGDALLLHLNADAAEVGRWHNRLGLYPPTRRAASGNDARLRVNGEDVEVDSIEVRAAGTRLLVDANVPGPGPADASSPTPASIPPSVTWRPRWGRAGPTPTSNSGG